MRGLLNEVETANQALIAALNVKVAKQGISREAKLLNERIASASRYIDSCRYEPDEAVRASAVALKQRFSAEGKAFNHMKVDTRVGALRVLLRDLATPEMQAHEPTRQYFLFHKAEELIWLISESALYSPRAR